MDLQGIKKKRSVIQELHASVKGESCRSRPMLDDAEAISMFINTLKVSYYSHLLGHILTNLVDLVKSREMVGQRIQMGKMEDPLRG